MHPRDLCASSLNAEHNDRRKLPQRSAPQQPPVTARLSEPVRGCAAEFSKAEASGVRSCGVTQRAPPQPPDAHVLRREPWSLPDPGVYRYTSAAQASTTEHLYPQRNISPRQTFQENMRRIMVPPRSDLSKIVPEQITPSVNFPLQADQSISKNLKLNSLADPKYCEVPYLTNPTLKPHRASVVRNSEVYPVRGCPTAYYPSEYCPPQHSVTAPRNTKLPLEKCTEELQAVFSENVHRNQAVRYEPYPSPNDKYPRARYEYINFHNSYQPYLPTSHKYDSTKPVVPHAFVNYTPQKYVDPRIADPHSETYARPAQHVRSLNTMQPGDYISAKFVPPAAHYPLQNKFYGYPVDSGLRHLQTVGKNPYEMGRAYYEYDYSRMKPLPVSDNPYMNEIPPYGSRAHYPVHGYPLHNAPPKPANYFYHNLGDNTALKTYPEHLTQYKCADIRQSTHNPLAKIPAQFSPNVISPSESNTSTESVPTLGTQHEDCGYASQGSTASGKSFDFSHYKPHHYEQSVNDNRTYGPVHSSYIKRPREYYQLDQSNDNTSTKDKSIDVRQFLQMWDEHDEDDVSKPKESISSGDPVASITIEAATTPAGQQQLYVLDLVNIPSEEIDKYGHIQKVCKLPENIRGYDSADLLNKFDEAFRPAASSSFTEVATSVQRELKTPPKPDIIHTARPPSPFDVEAKITQSVIHKDVGCNFEIKPCSPPIKSLGTSSLTETLERKIEKIVNQHIVQEPTGLSSLRPIADVDKNTMKFGEKRRLISDDTERIKGKIMKNDDSHCSFNCGESKFGSDEKEYGTVSRECLASLPRLDNEMELFTEINQQYSDLKNNQESVIITTSNSGLQITHEDEINKIPTSLPENCTNDINNQSENVFLTKEGSNFCSSQVIPFTSDDACNDNNIPKLSKFRRTKSLISTGNSDVTLIRSVQMAQQNSPVLRTDSVIIKNPDNFENTLSVLDEYTKFPCIGQPLHVVENKKNSKNKSVWAHAFTNQVKDVNVDDNLKSRNEYALSHDNPVHEMFSLPGSSPINLIMHSHTEDYGHCIRPSLIHCINNEAENKTDKTPCVNNVNEDTTNTKVAVCSKPDLGEIPINVAINLSIHSNQSDIYPTDVSSFGSCKDENFIPDCSEKTPTCSLQPVDQSNSGKDPISIDTTKAVPRDPPKILSKSENMENNISNPLKTGCEKPFGETQSYKDENPLDSLRKDITQANENKESISILHVQIADEYTKPLSPKTEECTAQNNTNEISSVPCHAKPENITATEALNAETASKNNDNFEVDADDQIEENIENIALHIMATGHIFYKENLKDSTDNDNTDSTDTVVTDKSLQTNNLQGLLSDTFSFNSLCDESAQVLSNNDEKLMAGNEDTSKEKENKEKKFNSNSNVDDIFYKSFNFKCEDTSNDPINNNLNKIKQINEKFEPKLNTVKIDSLIMETKSASENTDEHNIKRDSVRGTKLVLADVVEDSNHKISSAHKQSIHLPIHDSTDSTLGFDKIDGLNSGTELGLNLAIMNVPEQENTSIIHQKNNNMINQIQIQSADHSSDTATKTIVDHIDVGRNIETIEFLKVTENPTSNTVKKTQLLSRCSQLVSDVDIKSVDVVHSTELNKCVRSNTVTDVTTRDSDQLTEISTMQIDALSDINEKQITTDREDCYSNELSVLIKLSPDTEGGEIDDKDKNYNTDSAKSHVQTFTTKQKNTLDKPLELQILCGNELHSTEEVLDSAVVLKHENKLIISGSLETEGSSLLTEEKIIVDQMMEHKDNVEIIDHSESEFQENNNEEIGTGMMEILLNENINATKENSPRISNSENYTLADDEVSEENFEINSNESESFLSHNTARESDASENLKISDQEKSKFSEIEKSELCSDSSHSSNKVIISLPGQCSAKKNEESIKTSKIPSTENTGHSLHPFDEIDVDSVTEKVMIAHERNDQLLDCSSWSSVVRVYSPLRESPSNSEIILIYDSKNKDSIPISEIANEDITNNTDTKSLKNKIIENDEPEQRKDYCANDTTCKGINENVFLSCIASSLNTVGLECKTNTVIDVAKSFQNEHHDNVQYNTKTTKKETMGCIVETVLDKEIINISESNNSDPQMYKNANDDVQSDEFECCKNKNQLPSFADENSSVIFQFQTKAAADTEPFYKYEHEMKSVISDSNKNERLSLIKECAHGKNIFDHDESGDADASFDKNTTDLPGEEFECCENNSHKSFCANEDSIYPTKIEINMPKSFQNEHLDTTGISQCSKTETINFEVGIDLGNESLDINDSSDADDDITNNLDTEYVKNITEYEKIEHYCAYDTKRNDIKESMNNNEVAEYVSEIDRQVSCISSSLNTVNFECQTVINVAKCVGNDQNDNDGNVISITTKNETMNIIVEAVIDKTNIDIDERRGVDASVDTNANDNLLDYEFECCKNNTLQSTIEEEDNSVENEVITIGTTHNAEQSNNEVTTYTTCVKLVSEGVNTAQADFVTDSDRTGKIECSNSENDCLLNNKVSKPHDSNVTSVLGNINHTQNNNPANHGVEDEMQYHCKAVKNETLNICLHNSDDLSSTKNETFDLNNPSTVEVCENATQSKCNKGLDVHEAAKLGNVISLEKLNTKKELNIPLFDSLDVNTEDDMQKVMTSSEINDTKENENIDTSDLEVAECLPMITTVNKENIHKELSQPPTKLDDLEVMQKFSMLKNGSTKFEDFECNKNIGKVPLTKLDTIEVRQETSVIKNDIIKFERNQFEYREGIILDTYFDKTTQCSKKFVNNFATDNFINTQMSIISRKNRDTRWDKRDNKQFAESNDSTVNMSTGSEIKRVTDRQFSDSFNSCAVTDTNHGELSSHLSFIFENLSRKRRLSDKSLKATQFENTTSHNNLNSSCPHIPEPNIKVHMHGSNFADKTNGNVSKIAKLFFDDKESETKKLKIGFVCDDNIKRNIDSDKYVAKWRNVESDCLKYNGVNETIEEVCMLTEYVNQTSFEHASFLMDTDNNGCLLESEKRVANKEKTSDICDLSNIASETCLFENVSENNVIHHGENELKCDINNIQGKYADAPLDECNASVSSSLNKPVSSDELLSKIEDLELQKIPCNTAYINNKNIDIPKNEVEIKFQIEKDLTQKEHSSKERIANNTGYSPHVNEGSLAEVGQAKVNKMCNNIKYFEENNTPSIINDDYDIKVTNPEKKVREGSNLNDMTVKTFALVAGDDEIGEINKNPPLGDVKNIFNQDVTEKEMNKGYFISKNNPVHNDVEIIECGNFMESKLILIENNLSRVGSGISNVIPNTVDVLDVSKIKNYMEPDSTQECHGQTNNDAVDRIDKNTAFSQKQNRLFATSETSADSLSPEVNNNDAIHIEHLGQEVDIEVEECDSSQVNVLENDEKLIAIPNNQIDSTIDMSYCLDDSLEKQECLLIEDGCADTDTLQFTVCLVNSECDGENIATNTSCEDGSIQMDMLKQITNSPHSSDQNLDGSSSNDYLENYENGMNIQYEEMWIDDVACVETVVSENVPEEVSGSDHSDPPSPTGAIRARSPEFGERCNKYSLNFNFNKIKNIYGDNMDNNDINLVETLYRTPYMEVQNKLNDTDRIPSKVWPNVKSNIYSNEFENVNNTFNGSDSNTVCHVEAHLDLIHYPVSPAYSKETLKSKYVNCKVTNSKADLGTSRKLITKAAQKYIPPLKLSSHDLKVKLPLPEDRLKILQLLKIEQSKKLEQSPIPKLKISTSILPKVQVNSQHSRKLKPKFEDVLKHIDDAQYRVSMKLKNKKKKFKAVPKVIIKKNENGSHYTSTAVRNDFNPDLTGNKWQPWVILERSEFIDGMLSEGKTCTMFSHHHNKMIVQQRNGKENTSNVRKKLRYSIESYRKKPLKCTITLNSKYSEEYIPRSIQISQTSRTYNPTPRSQGVEKLS